MNDEKLENKNFSLKIFFKELLNNPFLGYTWIVTNLLIIFYIVNLILLGPAESLPIFGQVLDIHGITFLLLITFSFFLLFLFIILWFENIQSKIKKGNIYLKLLILNVIFFVGALFIPIGIFIGVYVVAFFCWYSLSALFFILFLRGITLKSMKKISLKNGFLPILLYLIIWFLSFGLFGFAFISIPWMSFDLFKQMPLLVFPLFIIILPLLGLSLKPKSGTRVPITLFSLLIFVYTFYNWIRYLTWTENSKVFTISDAVIDIILITYAFFAMSKNAKKFSGLMKNKISADQFLLLFIWSRISSMILLLTVSDYELFGISASEGSYLATMFLIMVVGFLVGIYWIRKGLTSKDFNSDILPAIEDQLK